MTQFVASSTGPAKPTPTPCRAARSIPVCAKSCGNARAMRRRIPAAACRQFDLLTPLSQEDAIARAQGELQFRATDFYAEIHGGIAAFQERNQGIRLHGSGRRDAHYSKSTR